jgi:hypothetical protein
MPDFTTRPLQDRTVDAIVAEATKRGAYAAPVFNRKGQIEEVHLVMANYRPASSGPPWGALRSGDRTRIRPSCPTSPLLCSAPWTPCGNHNVRTQKTQETEPGFHYFLTWTLTRMIRVMTIRSGSHARVQSNAWSSVERRPGWALAGVLIARKESLFASVTYSCDFNALQVHWVPCSRRSRCMSVKLLEVHGSSIPQFFL